MAEIKYLGGGCSCLSRPNCGHYSEGAFAMKASAISKSVAKKAAEAAKKAGKKNKKGR